MYRRSTSIIELNSKINIQILDILYCNCIIVGKKHIFNTYEVAIIELDDYTRIWMLPEELENLKINRKTLEYC